MTNLSDETSSNVPNNLPITRWDYDAFSLVYDFPVKNKWNLKHTFSSKYTNRAFDDLEKGKRAVKYLVNTTGIEWKYPLISMVCAESGLCDCCFEEVFIMSAIKAILPENSPKKDIDYVYQATRFMRFGPEKESSRAFKKAPPTQKEYLKKYVVEAMRCLCEAHNTFIPKH